MESPQRAVAAHNDEHALLEDVVGHVTARFLELAAVRNQMPGLEENARAFLLEDFLVIKEAGRQRIARRLVLEGPFHVALHAAGLR